MSSDRASAPSFELHYPSVPVDESPANSNSTLQPMRSHTRRLPEEASSSLEESAYEVLGDSSYELSEDEGRTESLASTDIQTPDDISSVADTEDSEDGHEYEMPEQHWDAQAESAYQGFDVSTKTALRDSSMMTSRAGSDPEASTYIDMMETASQSSTITDGCGVIRSFGAHEVPDVLRLYRAPEVRIAVRMALAKDYFRVDRPFRIMYVGEIPSWAKEDLNGQIAAALTASSESSLAASGPSSSHSSRFSIVQGPVFNEGASSAKVQLVESSGIELLVDRCSNVSKTDSSRPGKASSIEITLNDTTRLLFSPGEEVHIHGESCVPHLPDLAIFCHSAGSPISSSLVQLQQHQLVREALNSRSIPILDIAMVRPFHKCPDSFSFNSETLRSCVEGRGHATARYQILETLPVDIFSFLEIHPAQLNRHLAYITRGDDTIKVNIDGASVESGTRVSEQRTAVGRLENSLAASIRKQWKTLSTMAWQARTLQGLLAFTILAMTLTCLSMHQTRIPYLTTDVAVTDMPSMTSVVSHISSSTSTASTVAAPSTEPSKEVSMVTPETSLWPVKSVRPRKGDGPKEFQIRSVDDHRFEIVPPCSLARMRRPPRLSVEILRNDRSIGSESSELINGTYTVDIGPEQAYGVINLNVSTQAKPFISRCFEVSLPPRRPTLMLVAGRVERLTKAVQQEVAVVQNGLKEISLRLSSGLHDGTQRVEGSTSVVLEQTLQWRDQVKQAAQSVAQHLLEAQREAGQQLISSYRTTKELSNTLHRNWNSLANRASEIARKAPRIESTTVWQQTAPVRKSRSMLGARKNAINVWQKLGKARQGGMPRKDRVTAKGSKKQLRRTRREGAKHGAGRG